LPIAIEYHPARSRSAVLGVRLERDLESTAASTVRGHARLALVAVLVALAFALRLYGASAPGFSEDEINKVHAARAYLRGDFSQNLEHPMLMKLQIAACLVAADAWNARVSSTASIPEEVAVRMPNILFGALTTAVLFLLAELFFGTAAGLVAAALWAAGPMPIAVNRIAKEDTQLVFFFWSCLYFYERAKRYGANHVAAQARTFGVAGACLGLMLASKYFPHFWGVLFLLYHFAGRDETNQPLTRADVVAFNAAFVGFFVAFNPVVLSPATWDYFLHYAREGTVTHHGYEMMGRIYPNNLSASPGGLPVYFYPLMLALKSPLAVVVAFAVGLAVAVRRRRERGAFAMLWLFGMWIVPYSLVAAKWLRYLVSVLPVFYMLAALGAITLARGVGARAAPRYRQVAAGALLAALVATSVVAATSTAPFYALYLNALGGGRAAWYFPHDEVYDAGLREAIALVSREAPRGAVVYGEAPPVWHYYLERFERTDVRFRALSDGVTAGEAFRADYVVVQRGRRYFENAETIDAVVERSRPAATVKVAGVDAVWVYTSAPDSNGGELVVRERFDGVHVRGAKRRVERADHAAEQPDDPRDREPLGLELDLEARRPSDRQSGEQRDREPDEHADSADHERLALDDAGDEGARRAEALENPDLPRALDHRGVHRKQDDERRDEQREADHDVEERIQGRNALRVEGRQVARHQDLVLGEAIAKRPRDRLDVDARPCLDH
jgi:hypothetical protein